MMKGWKEIRIGDVAECNVSVINKDYIYEQIEYLDTGSVKEGHILETMRYDISLAPGRAKRCVKHNSIIYSTVRPNLKHFAIIKNPKSNLIVSTGFVVLDPDIRYIDPDYLYYYLTLNNITEYLHMIAEGAVSAYPSIRPEELLNIKIKIPSLELQQKIASVLAAYDDLIEVNKQQIALLEEEARELYKEWFVRMRFPGHQSVRFVNGIPEGWEYTTLGSLVRIRMGQSPPSKFYNENQVGLPFHQGVGSYGQRFPKHVVYTSYGSKIAEEGDILFSVRAPVGRLNRVNTKIVIGRGLAAMRHSQGLNSFLFYFLNNEFSDEDKIGNGAIFNAVGKDELYKYKVLINYDITKKFDDVVKHIDKQIEYLIVQNQHLSEIRDHLLPRLMSGRLSVKE